MAQLGLFSDIYTLCLMQSLFENIKSFVKDKFKPSATAIQFLRKAMLKSSPDVSPRDGDPQDDFTSATAEASINFDLEPPYRSSENITTESDVEEKN